MKKTIALSAALLLCVLAGRAVPSDHEHPPVAAFYGTVEALPQNGLQGTWTVNGREIQVTPGTEIDQEHGPVAVGAYVKVEGNFSGRSFIVQELEVKRSSRLCNLKTREAYNYKFAGTVEKMPENGHEGLWIVGGREIEVGSATMIDETAAKAAAGCQVEIKGVRAGNAVKAVEIRIAAAPQADSAGQPAYGNI